MKNYLLMISILFLNSCAAFTPVMDDVEKMVDDDAITIKCDKDAFQKDTNVHINLDVVNQPSIK